MKIECDPDKEATNVAKHGISLLRAAELEILAVEPDLRFDYGEARYRAWGLIDGQTHCLAFTTRDERLRAISLRRAHQKEIDRYVQKSGLRRR